MSSRFRKASPPAFAATRTGSGDAPQVIDSAGMRSLRFSSTAVQSAMSLDAPADLALGYTRTMMGFLLFNPAPAAIGMIGLGGGSLAKYCRHHLPATRFIAVESNPAVVALRDRFDIPPDDALFRVLEANGEDWVNDRADEVDVLLLDGYTRAGIPSELSEQGFYDNCHSKLAEDGLLVANLSTNDPKMGIYARRLRESFDGRAVSIEAADRGNRILFASKGKGFDLLIRPAKRRALELRQHHAIGLRETALRLLERIRRQSSDGLEVGDGQGPGARAAAP
jgi:spermidine synthase